MKTFLKFLAALLVVIIIVIAGLYIAISIPKKVNVTWAKEDLDSYNQKTHAQIPLKNLSDTNASETSASETSSKGASLEDLLFNNFKSTGSVKVEGVLTSSEVTAMANNVSRGESIFKDVRIGFRDDGTMEASGYIGPSVEKITNLFPEVKQYENLIKMAEGKPVYWRYSLTRVGDKQFDAHTVELRVGQVPVPIEQAGSGLASAGSTLNNMISRIEGFSCEELKIDKQGFHFKGSIPDALEYVDPQGLLDSN